MLRMILLIVMFAVLAVLVPDARAQATGGTCPTVSTYLQASSNGLVTLSALGITNCFFIAANGADTNSGTSEASPWLHAPGMPNCANNCAITPVSGNGFIFRGGDTWHFGNSSASPYVGSGGWTLGENGTSSNPIYYGFDPAWYSGSSWARPILNGDNSLSTSFVSSCTYPMVADEIELAGSYQIIDNFEMSGFCMGATSSAESYVDTGSGDYNILQNDYFHGWTSVTQNGSQTSYLFVVHSGSGGAALDNIYSHIVIDGSDSLPSAGQAMRYSLSYVYYSVFNNTSQLIGVGNDAHDNLVEGIVEPADGVTHGNNWEGILNGTSPKVFYNNLVINSSSAVNIWLAPGTGATYYSFNNIVYGITGAGASANYWNIGSNVQDEGTQFIFNNTFENPGSAIIFCASTYAHPWTTNSNMYITSGSQYSCPYGNVAEITDNTVLTPSAATTAGYTASNNYAPTAATSVSVGAGTNNSSYCSAISSIPGAQAACMQDTTAGVLYDSVNHIATMSTVRTPNARPATTAWDAGAYQYSSTTSSAPQPPTNLTVTAIN